jgi:mannosyltransferase
MNYRATDQGILFQPIREESASWQGHLTALIPVMTLYLALAFYQIDNQSLWTDEIISLNFAVSAEPISSVWFSSQCPLYYVLLRVWTKAAGTTELALRSLSAILGALAVSLIYAIGLKLFNRRTAAIAALLLATSPFFVWYSQEVRYINLMLATSLLATYSFYRAVSGGRFGWWVGYGTASILAVFSFVSVIFLFLAHGLYVLWSRSGWTVLSKWIVCQLVTFILFTAWFGAVYGARLGPEFTKAPISISVRHTPTYEMQRVVDLAGTIPYTFLAFSAGFSLGPSVRELHVSRSLHSLVNHVPTLVPVGILFASLFLFGLARLREDRGAGIFLLLWLGVIIVGVFVLAAVTTFHVYNIRYVATAFPAFILILAVGITGFRRQPLQITILSGLLFVNGLSLAHYYFNPRYAREDARSAAQYLESRAHPGDVILAVGSAAALRHYYKGSVLVVVADGRSTKNGLVVEHLRKLGTDDRLWLVEIRPWEGDPKSTVKAALDNLARRSDDKKFPGVEIYSYQPAH